MDKANPMRTLLPATLGIGTLDLLFAWGFWASKGVTLTDILHSIAAGWYGKASYEMGMTSALVGTVSHYAIMLAFVLAYWLAARRIPALRAHPWGGGLAHGLGIYALMSFVVLPLSAAGTPDFRNGAWVASSIAMHLLIGVLCAFAARRALR
ncbi:hypothetical protein [Thermomonas aquatica]|uniref:DUF1440 domain-containing protein n=1 Tax=Thermomonas aquatica TaxID=2202149 RepID=A0A5B7ZSF8_9GAMM|nr:hypothetical protein [Thermomonas aquatica]QDA56732.1 hypothetical protein FHQ07_05075 [Thermomonas aquatica]